MLEPSLRETRSPFLGEVFLHSMLSSRGRPRPNVGLSFSSKIAHEKHGYNRTVFAFGF